VLLLLIAGLARADDSAVLVSGFQSSAPDAAPLAALIENLVAERLDDEVGIRVVRVEETPSFEDYDARTYMDGCPAGQYVGCTLILGERGDARFALTGTVGPGRSGELGVAVSIIDVQDSRVMVAFQSAVPAGQDAAVADGIVKVLLAAVRGEIGQVQDIRVDGAGGDPAERPSNDELAAQIAELSGELGQVSAVISEPRDSIRRPTYTVADLSAQMEGEGLKPWERAGMSPGAWLRFKNSGMSLEEWRARSTGRQLELHLRLTGGWWRGPVDSIFYARYAYDPSLTVIDSWSSLQADTGNGPQLGGEVALGVLPWLDAGLAGGAGFGHMDVDVSSTSAAATPIRYQSQTPWFGLRVNFAPFPTWNARPTAGLGMTLAHTPGADTVGLALPADVLPVAGRWLAYAQVSVGGEVQLGDHLGLFLRVPVDLLVGGEPVGEARETTEAALVPALPDADASVATGALIGVQVRLFGRRPPASTLLDEEP